MFVFIVEARRCIVAATVILAAVLVANAAAAAAADGGGGGGHDCDQQEGVNAQFRCWQSVEALSKKKEKMRRTTFEVRLEKRGLTSKKTAKPTAAPDDQHEDLVQNMPGYDEPTLPTKQYSGYLNPVGECDAPINGPECRVHYMLALADIDTDDDDDDGSSKYEAAMSAPTVLWMNGGPGASSVAGYYIELGPLLLNATGDGVFENPYSWTKAGVNLLVMESPLGVGYSYCANQFDNTIGTCNNTDVSTANLNRAALVDFFANKFPQLSDNDFYIIGESYAGVYIPTLAKELLEKTDIKLKGIAVGDPCTDNESQQQSMDALWYANKYGLLNSTFYETITSDECKGDYLSMLLQQFDNYGGDSGTTGDTAELYDAELPKECILAHRKILMSSSNGLAGRWPDRYIAHDSLYGLVEKYQNGKPFQKLSAYMNRPDVRKALNMAESPVQQWFFAGRAGHTMNYRMQYAACTFSQPENEIEFFNISMVDLYREISPKIDKTWIYSGDADPNVPYEGTRKAIEKIGFGIVQGGDYRAWFFNKDPVRNQQLLFEKPITYGPDLVQHPIQPQFGGEVVNYEHGLSFVTMHGGGHLVPVSRPEASLHFFQKFVDGTGSSMLSPPLPSDQTLVESSEGNFQGIIANWTNAAKNPPYVLV